MREIKNLYIIPEKDNIAESLRLCEEYGAGFEYNDFFIPDLLDDKEALKSRIEFYKSLDRGTHTKKDTLHGTFFDICLNSADRKIRKISEERVIQSLDVASMLGCGGVIFHTNNIPGFELESYLNNWVDMNAEFYTKMCKKYTDVKIYVENMFDNSPEMLARLCQRMNEVSNFGVCFDVAHANLHKTPVDKWLKDLSGNIGHLHINDNDGLSDMHECVGEGTINWSDFFSKLDDNNISADMLIEVSGANKQRRSLEYLKDNGFI